MTKKVLFSGCSLTAAAPDSGFSVENHSHYHWSHMLANHYNTKFQNIGIGGMSNQEICVRSIDECLDNRYDLVVVMWSSIGRKWIYHNEENVDDFTGMTPGEIFGFKSSDYSSKSFHKLYYSFFQNHYVELKHWLLQTILLASFFASRNQPYVFIKGFDNFITDFLKIEYNNGFMDCTESLARVLDFNNRPDDFILDKINNIKNLINENKKSNWVNLTTESYMDILEDVADDLSHPGPITNGKMCSQIIQYIDTQRLL